MENIDLSDFFKTKSEANDFFMRLATISQSVYETGFNLEKAVAEQFGLAKKDKFMTLLRENKIHVESNTSLKDFLTALQKTASTLPTLSLTVAFEPREQTLKTLSEWFLLNTKKQVLFEITVDKNIIAGTSLNFKGKHVDYSIKNKVNQIIKDTLYPPAAPTPKEYQISQAQPVTT